MVYKKLEKSIQNSLLLGYMSCRQTCGWNVFYIDHGSTKAIAFFTLEIVELILTLDYLNSNFVILVISFNFKDHGWCWIWRELGQMFKKFGGLVVLTKFICFKNKGFLSNRTTSLHPNVATETKTSYKIFRSDNCTTSGWPFKMA